MYDYVMYELSVPFHSVPFRFAPFRFVLFRFVLFIFILFRFFSFCCVPFRFLFFLFHFSLLVLRSVVHTRPVVPLSALYLLRSNLLFLSFVFFLALCCVSFRFWLFCLFSLC